jgi:hypothetical protein
VTEEQRHKREQKDAEEGGSLADFYVRNGIAWGAADMFLIGDRDVHEHVAEFLSILRAHLGDQRSR